MSVTISEVDYVKNVLVRNFGFKHEQKLSETVGYTCLSIPAREALLFAIYTQAGFLLDEEHKLSLRPPLTCLLCQPLIVKLPLSRELWTISGEPYVPEYGLRPTILEWKQRYPSLFEGEKFVVLFNYRTDGVSEKYLRRLFRERFRRLIEGVKQSGKSFTDFIPFPIPTGSKEFYVPEGFFEYASGRILSKMGYLVTTLYGTGGDLSAFKIPSLIQDLREAGIFSDGGFLAEVMLHAVFGDVKPQPSLTPLDENLVVAAVEAESSPQRTRSYSANAGFGQISKYLIAGNCNQAFVTGPLCFATDERIGTISFFQDGTLFFNDAPIWPSLVDEKIVDRIKKIVQLLRGGS